MRHGRPALAVVLRPACDRPVALPPRACDASNTSLSADRWIGGVHFYLLGLSGAGIGARRVLEWTCSLSIGYARERETGCDSIGRVGWPTSTVKAGNISAAFCIRAASEDAARRMHECSNLTTNATIQLRTRMQ